MKRIYVICPVRHITEEQKIEIDNYVKKIEKQGYKVHYPPRDVIQEDATGWNICEAHRNAILKCDEVHIFWDTTSIGSHFDLGMAFVLRKKLKLIKSYHKDKKEKSYLKVIKEESKNEK